MTKLIERWEALTNSGRDSVIAVGLMGWQGITPLQGGPGLLVGYSPENKTPFASGVPLFTTSLDAAAEVFKQRERDGYDWQLYKTDKGYAAGFWLPTDLHTDPKEEDQETPARAICLAALLTNEQAFAAALAQVEMGDCPGD